MNVGATLIAIAPIQLSEFEAWPAGTPVEVVKRVDHETRATRDAFGGYSVELQAADGSIGSFAAIDVEGEYACFGAI